MSEETASDPNDYVTSRRLKELYDARRSVLEANKEATRLRLEGNPIAAQQTYREAIKGYLLEIQPLLIEFGEEDLWNSHDFGTIPVEPPNDKLSSPGHCVPHIYKTEHNGEEITIEEPLPSKLTFHINGFSTLLDTDSPITASFDYKVSSPLKDNISIEQTFYIPVSALDRMVIRANRFLAEHGLDISSDDELPKHEL